MMKRFALFFVLLLLAGLPLTIVAAQGRSNTLIFGLPGDMDATFNSTQTTTVNAGLVTLYLWPTLSEPDPMTGGRIPSLATWEISEDGLTYTFKIREDANWSDGTPITANDVKFTYDAIASDLVASPRKTNVRRIKEINVIDDKTVAFVFTEVYCTALYDLALGILPAHKYAADLSDFTTGDFNFKPDVSGGAFILEQRSQDEFIRLVANPNYFKGKPKLDGMVFQVIVDPAVIVQGALAGELDWIERVTPEYVDQLADSGVVDLYTFASNRLIPIWFNHADPTNPMDAYDASGNLNEQGTHPIFSDLNVRKAFVMGWNHDDAIALLGKGPRRIPGTITSAVGWALNEDIELYPYDPDAAGKLLDEAGWMMNSATGIREKAGKPLEFGFDFVPGILASDNMALIIQDQLGQLGMKVNATGLELGAYVQKIQSQVFDVSMVGFSGATPDPHELSDSLLHSRNDRVGAGFNAGSYVNLKVDELIEQGNTTPGCAPEDRAPAYKEMQRLVHEDVGYDFVSDRVSITALNKRVQNVVFGPWTFNDISEWTLAGS